MGDRRSAGTVIEESTWRDFCRSLERAGAEILAKAPEDDFDRAEGLRYVSRLTTFALLSCIERSDPSAPTLSTDTPKIGGDNPDYAYAGASISGEHTYRLRGERGDAHRIGLGTYYGGLGTEKGLQCSGYVSDDDLAFDEKGRFVLTLSCQEPEGLWLPMRPETNQLTIRQTLLQRREQRPATFELERVDAGEPPQPLRAAAFAGALARAGHMVEGIVAQFLGWTNEFASHPNEVRPLPAELLAMARGDPSTRYYNGYYELGPDEALVVLLDPPECDYWNFQVCNHWLESLDYMHYTTHVNHHTAVREPDGAVRVVVAARDPGVPNWIDTVGHARGCIALRWVGADRDSQPETKVVKLSEL